MIEWKDFDIANHPEDGQYLVFCEAHQFDSKWVDIARFDGAWNSFRSHVSSSKRVTKYAEINFPATKSLKDMTFNVELTGDALARRPAEPKA